MLNVECPCVENLFDISESDFIAARDDWRPELEFLCEIMKKNSVYMEKYGKSPMFLLECRKWKYEVKYPESIL